MMYPRVRIKHMRNMTRPCSYRRLRLFIASISVPNSRYYPSPHTFSNELTTHPFWRKGHYPYHINIFIKYPYPTSYPTFNTVYPRLLSTYKRPFYIPTKYPRSSCPASHISHFP